MILYEYLDGRMETYVIGGCVARVPHHATVIMFDFSASPQLTITGGTGASNAPPFHVTLPIYQCVSFIAASVSTNSVKGALRTNIS